MFLEPSRDNARRVRVLLRSIVPLLLGCVINVGEDDCSKCDNAPRCHSTIDAATDECRCDAGYTWANPGNDNDFECSKIPPKPGTSQCVEEHSYVLGDSCFCDDGFKWCVPDMDDLTCCVDDNQAMSVPVDTDSGTDTDATAEESGEREVELPPCTMDNVLGCTNPETSRREPTFVCMAGAWVELDEDARCQAPLLQGEEMGDFGYGCYLSATDGAVVLDCGNGPGSVCTDSDAACVDATTLHFCEFGRLTALNCFDDCTDPMRGEGSFDNGRCEAAACVCCNMGDAGCPM